MSANTTIARFCMVAATALHFAVPAGATQIAIPANRDNSLFQDSDNSCGNGSMFAGQTGQFGVRRAVIGFDVASAIPPGSTITSVELDLYVGTSGPSASGTDVFELHRLLANWGEGTTACSLGQGSPPQTGDATWNYAFYATTPWTAPGGDFVPTASVSIQMPISGAAPFPSTPEMVADVQGWLNQPAGSFGWIIIGDESKARTARRIQSREEALAPSLLIDYTAPPGPPPAVPDGQTGSPLRIAKAAPGSPDLVVSWDVTTCAGAADHHVLFGTKSGFPAALGGAYALAGSVCDVGSTSPYTWTGSPDPAALDPSSRLLFVLVVADDDASTEGSWGRSSLAFERKGPGANGSSNQCGILDKDLSNACGNGR